jgi:hypothetical protein
MQELHLADALNPSLKPSERAAASRAWNVLEAQRRDIRYAYRRIGKYADGSKRNAKPRPQGPLAPRPIALVQPAPEPPTPPTEG